MTAVWNGWILLVACGHAALFHVPLFEPQMDSWTFSLLKPERNGTKRS